MYNLFLGGSQLEKQLLRCTFHGNFQFSESEPIRSINITSSNSEFFEFLKDEKFSNKF